jgi:hypothetical protein
MGEISTRPIEIPARASRMSALTSVLRRTIFIILPGSAIQSPFPSHCGHRARVEHMTLFSSIRDRIEKASIQ